MDWNKAFDKTLRTYGVSAKWLSEQTGLSQQTISYFRKGRQPMTTENLGKLLMKLSTEAREYYFSLVLGASVPKRSLSFEEEIEELIDKADHAQIAILLSMLSAKFSSLSSSKDLSQEKVLLG